MLESGIGRAPNLALCTLPGFTHPADMSQSSVLYQEDLVHPSYEVDAEGSICVSSEPGLGYEVNEDLVEAWTVQRLDVPVPDAKEALRASTINQE
jgi:O-succinylbenzoate synthase